MNDQIYERAKIRLKEAEEEAARLRRFLVDYERVAVLLGVTTVPPKTIEGERNVPAATVASEPKGSENGQLRTEKAALLDAAADILRERQPLPTKELFGALQDRGVQIGGTDKMHNLTNHLRRSGGRFQAQRGVGWSLVEQASQQPPRMTADEAREAFEQNPLAPGAGTDNATNQQDREKDDDNL